MSEETVTQPEGQAEPSDFVHLRDDGTIFLSPEAEAAMEGVEPPKEATPPTEAAPPAEPAPKITRKLKWQGQEVEIDPTQEEELLQKGYDYTRKTQQLAAERDALTPFTGLINAVRQDPGLTKHIADYLQGSKKEEVKTFDDPIEQLKYETRQEVLKEVEEKFFKPMQAQTQQMTHQQVIERTKAQVAADPLNKEVHTAIMQDCFDHGLNPESLDSQGRVIRPDLSDPIAISMYLQLDQDPQAYLRTYNRQRTKIVAKPPPTTAKQDQPVATKRETKAPFLESAAAGGTDSTTDQKKSALIKELTKKSRNGDFTATGKLLELMS